jgi:hypothetical protein
MYMNERKQRGLITLYFLVADRYVNVDDKKKCKVIKNREQKLSHEIFLTDTYLTTAWEYYLYRVYLLYQQNTGTVVCKEKSIDSTA